MMPLTLVLPCGAYGAGQDAINLAMRCLHRAWEKGASRKAAVRIAASVLTKAAVDRGSKDNVTVVIVDLKAPKPVAFGGVPPDGPEAACVEHCARALAQQDTLTHAPLGEGAGASARAFVKQDTIARSQCAAAAVATSEEGVPPGVHTGP